MGTLIFFILVLLLFYYFLIHPFVKSAKTRKKIKQAYVGDKDALWELSYEFSEMSKLKSYNASDVPRPLRKYLKYSTPEMNELRSLILKSLRQDFRAYGCEDETTEELLNEFFDVALKKNNNDKDAARCDILNLILSVNFSL